MTESAKKRRGPMEGVGRKVDRALHEADKEAERVIAYINDEVVPAVRQHSSRALRIAAGELARMADYLDRTRRKK